MADDARELADAAERFERASERLASALAAAGNSGNQSTITLNAGGTAVWIAVTACAMMLSVNIVLIVLLVNHDRKIDDMEHYINAIYMVAPQLRPKE